MKPTGTLIFFLIFLAGAIAAGIWGFFFNGWHDGTQPVFYGCLGVAALIAVVSRTSGGAWFTDNSGGH